MTKVAVLIPCYNEENTILKVIAEARAFMPKAIIFVGDNNSTDSTSEVALKAGAKVIFEGRQGKGAMVQAMFDEIDADIYVLTDGDDTYDLSSVPEMINQIKDGSRDLIIGNRVPFGESNEENSHYRLGHAAGNQLISKLFSLSFNFKIQDTLSGLRVMNKAFVKSFRSRSQGFEIESELNVHAAILKAKTGELPCKYRSRPLGSESKLNTYRDGARIIRYILRDFRSINPFVAFAILALPWLVISAALVTIPFAEWVTTGQVERFPSLIAGVGAFVVGVNLITAGIIIQRTAELRSMLTLDRYLAIKSMK